MRIGIIGAPSSGKSKLAKSMRLSLNRDGEEQAWKVIDGYVDELTSRTDTTYGPGAGYIENVQIMSYRWLLEDEESKKGYHTITCGTIYETFCYAAMLNVNPVADEQARLYQHQIVSTMMNFFALVEPAGRYDRVFYLPWPEERQHEHSWDAVLNAKLPDILSMCGVTCTVLTGSHRDKLRDALKVTRFIRDEIYAGGFEETAMDVESGVR